MSEARFEEKIIYKTHQHWIVLALNTCKLIIKIAIPVGVIIFLLTGFSYQWAVIVFLIIALGLAIYDHYLWHHSWLMIGNQKITLSVRNGIFSQYAMNIRYRNIRDSAVSKNSMLGYLLKFGTLFVRSSANEGDFQAKFVPKVGKVYALVNALSRYSDDERARIHSIEELYAFHREREFGHLETQTDISVEKNTEILKTLAGVSEVIEIAQEVRDYIKKHEEVRNRGINEVLSRRHVLAFLHDSAFRDPAGPIVDKTLSGEIYFPSVPFPEVQGSNVVSASPGERIHAYLLGFFPYAQKDDASILIGWD